MFAHTHSVFQSLENNGNTFGKNAIFLTYQTFIIDVTLQIKHSLSKRIFIKTGVTVIMV